MRNFNEIKKSVVGGTPDLVSEWNNVVNKMKSEQNKWISELREKGFKAAHPNDGWVDRENNTIQLAYPQFNDDLKIGNKLMIGWAYRNERPVKITNITHAMGKMLTYYHFEDL